MFSAFGVSGKVLLGEWRVAWVSDVGQWGSLPVEGVLGVRDLPGAVARMGLQPGDPVFLAPDCDYRHWRCEAPQNRPASAGRNGSAKRRRSPSCSSVPLQGFEP